MDLVHCLTLLVFISTSSQASAQGSEFRFSTIYGDHMVLQQAPNQANVWGYTSDCEDKVTVKVNQDDYPATTLMASGKCKWHVTLLPIKADSQTSYTITATSQKHGSIKISDVLFGDVYVCSGQSNMVFPLPRVYNATDEVANAANYPMVRLFTAQLQQSPTPVDELLGITEPWSVASPEAVNGTGYFSAVCWLFGRGLYDYLGYPIGLISTNWGGTPVEAWSSPDALAKCGVDAANMKPQMRNRFIGHPEGPGDHSVLWNAMIYPFLNMTIKGAIWYQGEANSRAPETYHCTFPAMIDDWREKWYASTKQQTDELFGFGFVQLAADGTSNETAGGFQDIRWAQTANRGYVPNERLKNVFMAVAIDLGDPDSPYGSVHPRDKQDVGDRLVRSARAVVYNDLKVDFQGPLAESAVLSKTQAPIEVIVHFKSLLSVELKYKYGFEVGCSNATKAASQWIEGTAIEANENGLRVEFADCPSPLSPVSIRYCWRTDPCTFKKCPVYAGDLPSPPFIMDLGK